MDAAVIEVLQQAGSQDPEVLKPAEQMLKQWETERGFYTALYVSLMKTVHILNKDIQDSFKDRLTNVYCRMYSPIIPWLSM